MGKPDSLLGRLEGVARTRHLTTSRDGARVPCDAPREESVSPSAIENASGISRSKNLHDGSLVVTSTPLTRETLLLVPNLQSNPVDRTTIV